MELGKQQDARLYIARANLLRICHGEIGVMDFGKTCYGEVANLLQTCHLCCGLVTDILATQWESCH